MKLTYDQEKPQELDRLCKGIEHSLMMNLYQFTRERTSLTARYEYEGEEIHIIPAGNDLGGNGAKFIGKVKSHFSTLPKPQSISDLGVFYDYFVPISTYQELSGVVEVDINSAYWESAYKLGYLSDELYKAAYSEKISKKARLIALGVLGKKTVKTTFIPPYENLQTNEHYARTRVFWDNIVSELGEAMREVTARYKPHIFGMWFDAIFCSTQSAGNIRRFLLRRGYETKIKKLNSYKVIPRNGIIPGAKVIREFQDGKTKEMDVTYNRDAMSSLESFIDAIS